MSDFLTNNCTTNAGNSGRQSCKSLDGRAERIWLVPSTTTISTYANALLEATWDTLFNAAAGTRGFPLPPIFNADFAQGEDTYDEGWSNKQEFASEGLDTDTYMLEPVSLYNAKQLRTYNGNTWAAFIVTDENVIQGWSDDDTIFKPYTISSFRVGKRNKATGEEVEKVPVKITWADPSQREDYPAVVKPTWNALEIDGIKDLLVTASSPTTSSVVLTITGFDSQPHENAVLGDFVIYNSSSVSQSISSVTETSAGVYLVECSMASGTYTGGLLAQPNASTAYFETPTLATFYT